MKTTSQRVVDGSIDVTMRHAVRSAQSAVARAASRAARTLATNQWIIDLTGFGLAALLVGATALYGLGLVSVVAGPPKPPSADRFVSDQIEPTSMPVGARADLLCCHESQ